ncbi:hypothetical protein MKW92_024354 [Papaver armeniacum]|nr:hypothetical protein MKW92_024354 [Papaver armeniacum]
MNLVLSVLELKILSWFSKNLVKERREGYSGPRDGERGGTGRGRGGRRSSDGYTPNDSELEKDSNGFDREHGMRHGPGPYRPIRGGVNTWGDPLMVEIVIEESAIGGRKTEDLVMEMKEIISDEVEQRMHQHLKQQLMIGRVKINEENNEEKEAEAKKARRRPRKPRRKLPRKPRRRPRKPRKRPGEPRRKRYLKRKVLVAMKAEERKVELDKSFESMKLLKKGEEEIFVKLGSDKNSGKRREDGDREEKAKRYSCCICYNTLYSVSIIEFLKPAEGERRNYRSGGGRGDRGGGGRGDRGGGGRGATRGRGGGHNNNNARSSPDGPSIGDISLFPSLGGK